MRQGTLQKIKPMRSPQVLPDGAQPYGQLPDGTALYRVVRKRSRSVPSYEPIKTDQCGFNHQWMDDTVKDPVCLVCGVIGHQRHKKHQLTGEELVGIRKPVTYDEEIIGYWEDQLNGTAGIVPYVPPTPQETAAKERAEKKAKMQDALINMLVDSDVDPADLVNAMTRKPAMDTVVPEPLADITTTYADVPTTDTATTGPAYPVKLGGPWWQLSNGEKVRGKEEDAIAAEAKVAVGQANAVPEY